MKIISTLGHLTSINTDVTTLTMEMPVHVPCMCNISTHIPKRHTFIFENYWLKRDDFMQHVNLGRHIGRQHPDATKNLPANKV